MVGAGILVLGWSILFSGVSSMARADEPVSCESVCGSTGAGITGSIQRQWDQLFRGKRVCQIDDGAPRVEDPARWIEGHRDPQTGARMVAAFWTGGCQMNRPVKDELRELAEQEGSQGFVRRALESVGIQTGPECIQELPVGAPLRAGDILRLGQQAMVVASVGEDPFGMMGRLDALKTGLSARSGKKSSADVNQLCREWLMDASKFQISVIFLSSDKGGAPRVRQGSFGALVGEEHPGSRWDQAVQDWAVPDCAQRILGKVQRSIGVDSSSLKVERYSSGPGCRAPSVLRKGSRDLECARCCVSRGRTP